MRVQDQTALALQIWQTKCRVFLLRWCASPSITWLANYMKLFCEWYVFEDRKTCIDQSNLHSRNTVQYGVSSSTSSTIHLAARPTPRSHTACTADSDVKWATNKRTLSITTQKLTLLKDKSPSSCVFKMCFYIIILLKATDYCTVSANIKYLVCNNKYLQRRNFICCPYTMYAHKSYLLT